MTYYNELKMSKKQYLIHLIGDGVFEFSQLFLKCWNCTFFLLQARNQTL